MGQRFLDQKLAHFLELTRPESTAELQKELAEGHCFGYALCYAAMSFIGKRKWWESALNVIANWDNRLESLNALITLPDSDNNKPVTLSSIFERVLNYIIFHQTSSLSEFHPKNMNQFNILGKDIHDYRDHQDFFYLLDKDNEGGTIRRTIKHKEVVAGNLDLFDIDRLIDANSIKNTLCLVSSNDHTITIIHENEEWIIYNPNYTYKIHENFRHKATMIFEIFRILGHAISITVATFDPIKSPIFDKFEDIKKFKRMSLLENGGLNIMINDAPALIPGVIECIQESPETSENLARILLTKWDNKKDIIILQALNRHTDCLKEILDLASKNAESINILSETLFSKANGKYYSGLTIFVLHAPELIPELFEILAAKAPECFEPIVKMLLDEPELFDKTLNVLEANLADQKIMDLFNKIKRDHIPPYSNHPDILFKRKTPDEAESKLDNKRRRPHSLCELWT